MHASTKLMLLLLVLALSLSACGQDVDAANQAYETECGLTESDIELSLDDEDALVVTFPDAYFATYVNVGREAELVYTASSWCTNGGFVAMGHCPLGPAPGYTSPLETRTLSTASTPSGGVDVEGDPVLVRDVDYEILIALQDDMREATCTSEITVRKTF